MYTMLRILVKFKFLLFCFVACSFPINIQADSHWMVTENGLIQPRLESPFKLAQPYDLLAFLNQDTRWNNIINLYEDLSKRQILLSKLWLDLDKSTDINTILAEDENCVKTGHLNLLDWHTTFLEDGKHKIDYKEFLFGKLDYGTTDIPDCKKISSLTFSMLAFEHLEGVVNQENLSISPELSLPDHISPLMTVEQMGHWLAGVLKKNSSSWLHYNMASIYWRVKGNAVKAVECSRRAIHYAPRAYKDIALLSLGMILLRSKMTDDAVVVLNAAVDHDQMYPITHFVLANAYAVLGEYNSSMKHLDICLKLNPSFVLAVKHRSAVLCHMFLTRRMKVVEESLLKLREELARYTDREAHWLKSQAALLRTMELGDDFDYRNVDKNFEKLSKLTGLGIKELKKEGDKYSLIQYFMEGPMYNADWVKEKGVAVLDTAYNLQRLVRHVSHHVNIEEVAHKGDIELPDKDIMEEIGPTPTFPDMFPEVNKANTIGGSKINVIGSIPPPKPPAKMSTKDDMIEYQTGAILYPPTLKINRNMEDFDKNPEWPSVEFCKDIAPNFPVSNLVATYQIFLPFENKGINVKSLLSDKLGVPASIEHELPWYPPACPHDKDAAAFTNKKSHKPQVTKELMVTPHLRDKLIEYASGGHARPMQDAEIGHRIYLAMKKELAPKWIVLTLSSLYWRVRGNTGRALHCLMPATRAAPPQYKDVALVSLASLYLEMGYFEESLTAAEEAFKISLYEPATNFLLAELNMIKKHRNTHMFHLKQVVRIEPNFMSGLARNLLNIWACLFKQIIDRQDFDAGDICTQVEPGMSVVCEKDGSNCRMKNIQCYSGQDRETSTLVRMLELKDDNIQGVDMDDSRDAFDHVIDNMPSERSDIAAHQKNYDAMMKTVTNTLKICKNEDCSDIGAADVTLKQEDCARLQLQLGYWLHMMTLTQLTEELDPQFFSDIVATSPSLKKVPECRVSSGQDFFVERMAKVESVNGEPALSVMHQLADMFHFFDYASLGAKLAKYLETRGSAWRAQVMAAWWCGAGGRGSCAGRCVRAAARHSSRAALSHALRTHAALLHLHSKHQDAKEIAYLSFYASPKSKLEASLVALSHMYLEESGAAIRMYRYALALDPQLPVARAGLRAAACRVLYPQTPTPAYLYH